MADLLKLTQVARRLDVSERTARRLVKAGVLPSSFIGNSYRVSEEDVEKYLKSVKVSPGDTRQKAPSHSSPAAPEDQAAEEWHALAESIHTVRRWGSDLFYRDKNLDQGRLAEALANLYEELFSVGFERYHASRSRGAEEELAELRHALDKLAASSLEVLEMATQRERDPQRRGELTELFERQRARRAG